MEIYWLEQAEADVPNGDEWFGDRELAVLSRLSVDKRRADWRLGRWSAKRALAAYLNLAPGPRALRELEILPAPSGSPEVTIANRPVGLSISISHRGGFAVCAIAPCKAAIGCDLELVEPRSAAFISDFFTAEEQAMVARTSIADRPRLSALLWSAKESALKALRAGLRFDTRWVAVSLLDGVVGPAPDAPGSGKWRPLLVRCASGGSFHGWWNCAEKVMRTVVADPPPLPPRLLDLSPPLASAR